MDVKAYWIIPSPERNYKKNITCLTMFRLLYFITVYCQALSILLSRQIENVSKLVKFSIRQQGDKVKATMMLYNGRSTPTCQPPSERIHPGGRHRHSGGNESFGQAGDWSYTKRLKSKQKNCRLQVVFSRILL